MVTNRRLELLLNLFKEDYISGNEMAEKYNAASQTIFCIGWIGIDKDIFWQ